MLNFLSPIQTLFHKVFDLHFLKSFGCECFLYLRPFRHCKFSFHYECCVFIGYSPVHKGYKCLSLVSGKTYISSNVNFNEMCYPFAELSQISSPSPSPPFVFANSLVNPILPVPPREVSVTYENTNTSLCRSSLSRSHIQPTLSVSTPHLFSPSPLLPHHTPESSFTSPRGSPQHTFCEQFSTSPHVSTHTQHIDDTKSPSPQYCSPRSQAVLTPMHAIVED